MVSVDSLSVSHKNYSCSRQSSSSAADSSQHPRRRKAIRLFGVPSPTRLKPEFLSQPA
jgi:hypothetical protein